MFSSSYSRFADLTILWVYLAYSIYFVMLVAVLVTIFMILPRFGVNKGGHFSMNKDGQCFIPFSALVPFQSLLCEQSLSWLLVFSKIVQ